MWGGWICGSPVTVFLVGLVFFFIIIVVVLLLLSKNGFPGNRRFGALDAVAIKGRARMRDRV